MHRGELSRARLSSQLINLARGRGRRVRLVRVDDPSTVQQDEISLRVPPDSSYALTIVEGLDSGVRVAIDALLPSRLLVGTGPVCELHLSDPHVSRRHAAFEVTTHGLRVLDLGSTNGTYADGVRITDATLRGGEILRIGSTALRVDRAAPSSVAHLTDDMRFGRMIGGSPEMRRLYGLCKRLANSNIPIIIEGETGTGKEVLAEALHEASPRAKGPFVVFDCTTMPPNLIESALFGHERGAFTGADRDRVGMFEQADGGTLFVDELGELDVTLQPKLLRAIERSEVQRIGSHRWIEADVRIIAATRRDLDREVQAGRFRDDLFYRLAVGRIELPPLRNRHGDVALLARHFWREHGGEGRPLPPGLTERFEDYSWPGNVRELSNAVERRLAPGELDRLQSFFASRPDEMTCGALTLRAAAPRRRRSRAGTGSPFLECAWSRSRGLRAALRRACARAARRKRSSRSGGLRTSQTLLPDSSRSSFEVGCRRHRSSGSKGSGRIDEQEGGPATNRAFRAGHSRAVLGALQRPALQPLSLARLPGAGRA